MISKILMLLLPTLALASIQIHLTGDYGDGIEPHLDVYYNGYSIDIISDRDMKTFGLNNNALINAIEKYFHKRPSDVYLRSPTPFGDLYSSYSWSQVQRTLQPISAKALAVNSEPAVVLKETFENNSTKAATFNVGISQKVEDTVSSHWFKKDEVIFDAKSEVTVNVGGAKGSASSEFKYTTQWGEDYKKSNTVVVGATSALQILLEPRQTVLATLMATRTTVKIEVEYVATLSGSLAVNYKEPYRGHHFWNMDINAVCNAGGLNNKVVAREEITLNYYWNSKISVRDGPMLNNKVLLEVNY